MTPGRRESSLDQAALDRLRGFRVRADRARSLDLDCAELMKRVQRVSDEHDRVSGALETGIPDALRGSCWVESVQRGRVTLGVADAAARHGVERWVRSGGLATMRDLAKVSITRVTTRIVSRGS